MRAVRFEQVGSVVLRDLPVPDPDISQVVLRVRACGVCGTDRHILRGEYSAAAPVTLGHEFSGTIYAASTGSRFVPGLHVTIDPNIACGACRQCRAGDPCLCPRRLALGVDRDGGLAEYALVSESQLYPVPDGLPLELAAMCEPLACCLHALDLAEIKPGMSVAVVGGGVIGLIMTQIARLAGATRVVLATRQQSRRALAERFGATQTIDPQEELVRKLLQQGVAPDGVDVVFECVGSVATFEQSLAVSRRGGTVVVVGVAPEHDLARVSPFDIFARELRIVGSYLNPRTHGRAADLAAAGVLDLEALVTRRVSLDEIPAILQRPPDAGDVKVLAIP